MLILLVLLLLILMLLLLIIFLNLSTDERQTTNWEKGKEQE
jgi:hypothetical protein